MSETYTEIDEENEPTQDIQINVLDHDNMNEELPIKKGGKDQSQRTFTVVGAYNSKGCPTKFGSNTRYIGRTPSGAAKKAFTELCRVKSIRGVCTIYIKIRETTRGSHKKIY